MEKPIKEAIHIAKTPVPFPEELVRDLAYVSQSLEHYRRVHLAYTIIDPEVDDSEAMIMPTLILERIGAGENHDFRRLHEVMMSYYIDEEFAVRALPMGDWWETIKTNGIEIRGFAA
jgi:hypothetical protein